MSELSVVAIAPSVNLSLASKSHRVGPSTGNLRDENPIESLHEGRFDLVDPIVVSQLAVLSAAKGIETAVLGYNSGMKT